MAKYKIADVVFEVNPKYSFAKNHLIDYECNTDEKSELLITISSEDIEYERNLAPDFPEFALEDVAIFRKLCQFILANKNGIIFHSSAISVDGKAYLFTAPSGTGKSTHTALWRKVLGDRAVMINDDKPIIRFIDGAFYVYGTPWNGKHKLSTNTRAKLEGICHLTRNDENVIKKIKPSEMLAVVLNQTERPKTITLMDTLLILIDKMLNEVDLYKLGCNMELDAAITAIKAMGKGEIDL